MEKEALSKDAPSNSNNTRVFIAGGLAFVAVIIIVLIGFRPTRNPAAATFVNFTAALVDPPQQQQQQQPSPAPTPDELTVAAPPPPSDPPQRPQRERHAFHATTTDAAPSSSSSSESPSPPPPPPATPTPPAPPAVFYLRLPSKPGALSKQEVASRLRKLWSSVMEISAAVFELRGGRGDDEMARSLFAFLAQRPAQQRLGITLSIFDFSANFKKRLAPSNRRRALHIERNRTFVPFRENEDEATTSTFAFLSRSKESSGSPIVFEIVDGAVAWQHSFLLLLSNGNSASLDSSLLPGDKLLRVGPRVGPSAPFLGVGVPPGDEWSRSTYNPSVASRFYKTPESLCPSRQQGGDSRLAIHVALIWSCFCPSRSSSGMQDAATATTTTTTAAASTTALPPRYRSSFDADEDDSDDPDEYDDEAELNNINRKQRRQQQQQQQQRKKKPSSVEVEDIHNQQQTTKSVFAQACAGDETAADRAKCPKLATSIGILHDSYKTMLSVFANIDVFFHVPEHAEQFLLPSGYRKRLLLEGDENAIPGVTVYLVPHVQAEAPRWMAWKPRVLLRNQVGLYHLFLFAEADMALGLPHLRVFCDNHLRLSTLKSVPPIVDGTIRYEWDDQHLERRCPDRNDLGVTNPNNKFWVGDRLYLRVLAQSSGEKKFLYQAHWFASGTDLLAASKSSRYLEDREKLVPSCAWLNSSRDLNDNTFTVCPTTKVGRGRGLAVLLERAIFYETPQRILLNASGRGSEVLHAVPMNETRSSSNGQYCISDDVFVEHRSLHHIYTMGKRALDGNMICTASVPPKPTEKPTEN